MKKKTIFLLCFSPVFFALLWSFYPLIKAKFAAYRLTNTLEGKSKLLTQEKKLKQTIQAHFRDYKIYVPFEDIKLRSKLKKEKLLSSHENFCGHGNVLIWIPYKIKTPKFLQRKFISEFCISKL